MKKLLNIILSVTMLFSSMVLRGQEVERDTVIIGRLEFVVNTTKIIKNDCYDHFVNEFIPTLFFNEDRIVKVMLVGSASPEGPKERNLYLSRARALETLPFLKNIVPAEKLNVVSDSELFLQMSKCRKEDFDVRRGAYVEAWIRGKSKNRVDTLRFERIDTVYIHDTLYVHDTIYIEKPWRRIPILGVKTNMLSDVLITPNVQAELYTHLWGLSLEFDYTFPWFHKDYDKYFYYQILNGTVGIRKYLNNNYTGHYFGIYANTAIYDICPFDKDKGWQGEVYGGGLSYGYVFQNKKYPRIKLEPYIRVGWFDTKFDTYHASQPWDGKYYYNWYLRASDFVPRRFNMNYFGPTEIGINFTFDLICLRRY